MAYVRDAMTTELEMIEPRRSVLEAARGMVDRDVDALIVAEAGHLVGMVTQADIARAVAAERDPATTPIAEVMLPEVLFCYDDQATDEVAVKMRASLVRLLPVLSRDKTIIGMVREDDLDALAGRV